jgi:hypothetical protein
MAFYVPERQTPPVIEVEQRTRQNSIGLLHVRGSARFLRCGLTVRCVEDGVDLGLDAADFELTPHRAPSYSQHETPHVRI